MQASGVALVTGAARGLGAAVALALADRGFEVVATMRRPEAGAELPGRVRGRGSLRTAPLDVTRPDAFEMPVALRVLVNNAGVDAAHMPVEHTPLAAWREMFETNLFGLVETTRRAIPALRRAGGGVVCNVTSASLFVPVPLFAAYRASKAAVSAFGESLAVEVARFGIRVIEVAPGPIATGMLEASGQRPDTAGDAGYAGLADWLARGRDGAARHAVAPDAAAARIADAILDDASPLRNACDPLGEAQLAGRRGGGEEERLRAILRATAPAPDEPA